MRLFILIALASLIALATLPQSAMAGHAMAAHDCADCPQDMTGHDMAKGPGAPCAGMGHCAPALAFDLPWVPALSGPRPQAYLRPASASVRGIPVALELPPPRA